MRISKYKKGNAFSQNYHVARSNRGFDVHLYFVFVSFSLQPLQHWTEPNMHTNPPWINNNAKDYLMPVIQANSYDAFEKPTFK